LRNVGEIRPFQSDGIEDVEVVEEAEGNLAPAAEQVEAAAQRRKEAACTWAGGFAPSDGCHVGPEEAGRVQGEEVVEVSCIGRGRKKSVHSDQEYRILGR
jgi:hypothetical protein